jgi:hypothetical protein
VLRSIVREPAPDTSSASRGFYDMKIPFGKPVAEPISDAIQARRTMAID